ncbi:membrane protein [Sulfolobus acidocaldarius SUSAZ]|nr:membrane protein [Sulfolobus acidocaldarius SUSAZ]
MTSSPSDHLANERTFLAWIRTGIALIGFGFVIARFALFLEVLRGGKTTGSSVIYGEIMIVLGGIMIAYGTYNYLRNEKDLKNNTFTPRTTENTIFATFVLLIAIVLALIIIA